MDTLGKFYLSLTEFPGLSAFLLNWRLMKTAFSALILLIAFATSSAFAKGLPACFDRKDRIDFNESQVLAWKEFTENKFLARAFVRGIAVRLIEDRQKHIHIEVDLDKDMNTTDDRVEIIYNTKFGTLPDFRYGDEVIACGDFIKDTYSPVGAVIHWLHLNPKKGPHEDGFIAINGQVAGLSPEKK